MSSPTPHFYRGQHKCQATFKSGKPCGAKASYAAAGANNDSNEYTFFCGRHKPSEDDTSNPDAPFGVVQLKSKVHTIITHIQHEERAKHDATRRVLSPPVVALAVLPSNGMLPLLEHFQDVFPNRCQRELGLSYPALHPNNLGPVDHGQPGLPMATTLTGLVLGNCWHRKESEDVFHSTQLELYQSHDPPVRKPISTGAQDEWLGCSWVYPDGTRGWMSALSARKVYCQLYCRLAQGTLEYQLLLSLLDNNNESLRIAGPGGHPMEVGDINKRFQDVDVPFTWEQVLFVMLVWRNDQAMYPWG
jgi:hypothetical protein